MRSNFVLFACAGLGLALLMCGSDDDGGAGAGPNGGDGGASSSSGGGSSGTGSSSGSSGSTDGGPVAGPKRPTFANQKSLPEVYRVVPLSGGGWGVLVKPVTQQTSIDGKTLEPGGPVLLKLDAAGVIQWAKTLSTGGGSQNGPPRLAADEADNLYVSGLTYTNTVDFGDGVTVATGNGMTQTQVAFYGQVDSAGTAKWVRRVYDAQGVSDIQIAVRNGKIAIAGDYSPYLQLVYQTSAGNVAAPLHTRESDRTGYVLAGNSSDGYVTWAKFFGTERTAAEIGTTGIDSVAIDTAGEITIDGQYTVGPLLDTALDPIATPKAAAFVLKLGADGATKWVRAFENTDMGGMVADPTRVIAAGSIKADVDFGGGVRKGPAFFAVVLDPVNGTTTTDKTFGGGGTQMFAMAHDPGGGTALGFIVPFATAGGQVDNITLPVDNSSFILKLGADGKAQWVESYARPEAGSPTVFPAALAVDSTGKVAFGGTIPVSSHDFGGGVITATSGFLVWYTP